MLLYMKYMLFRPERNVWTALKLIELSTWRNISMYKYDHHSDRTEALGKWRVQWFPKSFSLHQMSCPTKRIDRVKVIKGIEYEEEHLYIFTNIILWFCLQVSRSITPKTDLYEIQWLFQLLNIYTNLWITLHYSTYKNCSRSIFLKPICKYKIFQLCTEQFSIHRMAVDGVWDTQTCSWPPCS